MVCQSTPSLARTFVVARYRVWLDFGFSRWVLVLKNGVLSELEPTSRSGEAVVWLDLSALSQTRSVSESINRRLLFSLRLAGELRRIRKLIGIYDMVRAIREDT